MGVSTVGWIERANKSKTKQPRLPLYVHQVTATIVFQLKAIRSQRQTKIKKDLISIRNNSHWSIQTFSVELSALLCEGGV